MYFTEPVPDYGKVSDIALGVRRIVARNPNLMTYRGTNTYLVDTPSGLLVIDPGPDDPVHLTAVLAAIGTTRPSAIVATHSHHDHIGNAAALRTQTEAPLLRMVTDFGAAYPVDGALVEGDITHGLQVVYTPGHAPDHICLSRDDGLLFSGDHVMSWSSSTVSPPNGNMSDYYASLRRLLMRADNLYLPGHGPPLPNPQTYVKMLLAHRISREDAILDMVQSGRHTPRDFVEKLYFRRDIRLFPAAERNVIAHLEKLETEGRVRHCEAGWEAIPEASRSNSR
jgi:glyoxylase-like metal-dependent hydrolase (beta-lactamase superfamily II)